MTLITITKSNDKRVPNGTIAELVSQDSKYYTMKHWHYDKNIKELISNCSVKTDSIVGRNVTHKDYKSTYVVQAYIEDYPSGSNTFTGVTGRRVSLKALNEATTFANKEPQTLDAVVANLTLT